LIWAIIAATPFFVVFGSWSDKVGRKWIMLIGMLLAVVTYRPIFNQFLSLSDLEQKTLVAEKTSILKDTTFFAEGKIIQQVTQVQHYNDGTTAKVLVESAAGKDAVTKVMSKNLGSNGYYQMIFFLFVL